MSEFGDGAEWMNDIAIEAGVSYETVKRVVKEEFAKIATLSTRLKQINYATEVARWRLLAEGTHLDASQIDPLPSNVLEPEVEPTPEVKVATLPHLRTTDFIWNAPVSQPNRGRPSTRDQVQVKIKRAIELCQAGTSLTNANLAIRREFGTGLGSRAKLAVLQVVPTAKTCKKCGKYGPCSCK